MFINSYLAILATAANMAAAIPAAKPGALATSNSALVKRQTSVGRGTVYDQTGPGSCQQNNPDSAIIAALNNKWMQSQSPGPYCGQKINATNTGSQYNNVQGEGNTIIATIQDTCPECGDGDVDFSQGSWAQLTNGSPMSVFTVSWHFCNEDDSC